MSRKVLKSKIWTDQYFWSKAYDSATRCILRDWPKIFFTQIFFTFWRFCLSWYAFWDSQKEVFNVDKDTFWMMKNWLSSGKSVNFSCVFQAFWLDMNKKYVKKWPSQIFQKWILAAKKGILSIISVHTHTRARTHARAKPSFREVNFRKVNRKTEHDVPTVDGKAGQACMHASSFSS